MFKALLTGVFCLSAIIQGTADTYTFKYADDDPAWEARARSDLKQLVDRAGTPVLSVDAKGSVGGDCVNKTLLECIISEDLIFSEQLSEHKKLIESLVNKGADLNGVLLAAVWYSAYLSEDAKNFEHYQDIIKLLIEKGASLNGVLLAAVSHSAYLSEDAKNFEHYQDIIKLLIEKGASVNEVTSNKENALMLFLAGANKQNLSDAYIAFVKMLIEKGIDIRAQDASRSTALIYAINSRISTRAKSAIVEELIRQSDVNQADIFEKTPLMYAADKGSEKIVTLLLSAGADIGARDFEGKTVYTYATAPGLKSILLSYSMKKLAESLDVLYKSTR